MNTRGDRRGRLTLFLMLAAAAAPFVLSWYLVNFTQVGRDAPGGNRGMLIAPPRPLQDQALYDPLTRKSDGRLHGRWTLIYIAGSGCDSHCEQALLTMRQVRLALGRDAERVQRLLLVPDVAQDLLPAAQLEAHAGQRVSELSRIGLDTFAIDDGGDPEPAHRIYLADPLGNLMMYYAPGAEPASIVKDLKRLLRYSRIG